MRFEDLAECSYSDVTARIAVSVFYCAFWVIIAVFVHYTGCRNNLPAAGQKRRLRDNVQGTPLEECFTVQTSLEM